MKLKRISLSNNEKLGLYSNLATMVAAGITVVEATESLLEDSKGNLKIILEVIIADTTQGQPLSISMAKFPLVFDNVTVSIIKAAEDAGTIDVVLKDLKESIKKDMEFMDRVKSALTYPIVIMIVFAGVIVLMITFVIPKISKVFAQLRVELPLPTKILVFSSNLIMNNIALFLIVFVLTIMALVWFIKTQRNLFINFVLGLPFVSNLAKEIDLTRFSRSMYLLISSGISITTSLEFAAEIVSRREMVKALHNTKELVSAGHPMSVGLKKKMEDKVFHSLMILLSGERSGSLERSMGELEEHFDYEVSRQLRLLTSLLEPIILVAVGVVIGGLMIAIIAPIYGLIGQVNVER